MKKIDRKNIENMNEEDLIEHFSYVYSDSEWFVEDNLENYKEMDHILKTIFESIKEMEKDYDIYLYDSSIHFTNKKAKTDYEIRIEF